MQTAAVVFTYDDYLAIPPDGKRYEIIQGELCMTPAPSTEHQEILLNLVDLLRSFVRAHSLGKVYCAPVDVVFSMTEVVQPDIIFISKDRAHIIAKKNVVAAPDLVVEILSEATEKTDRTAKRALYERFGVKEYWIVDPAKSRIEVFEYRDGKYASPALYDKSDTVRSLLLTGFAFAVDAVFEK